MITCIDLLRVIIRILTELLTRPSSTKYDDLGTKVKYQSTHSYRSNLMGDEWLDGNNSLLSTHFRG